MKVLAVWEVVALSLDELFFYVCKSDWKTKYLT